MVIWSCAPRPFVGALVRSRLIRALGGGTQMNAPALLRTAAGSATRVRRRTTRSSASGPGPLGDGTLRVRRGERNTAGDGEGANGVGGVVKRAREAGGVGGAKEDREVERRLLAWVELRKFDKLQYRTEYQHIADQVCGWTAPWQQCVVPIHEWPRLSLTSVDIDADLPPSLPCRTGSELIHTGYRFVFSAAPLDRLGSLRKHA